jgi:hypothetical protein
MKKKHIKNYLKTGILIIGISLIMTTCQKDDVTSEQEIETLQNNVKSSYVSSDQIPDIISLLGYNDNRTSMATSSKSNMISSPFGSIYIKNILEVIDTLGNKKYSFKLIPKTPKPNSIFNLVIDASGKTTNIAILEYRMSPNFAQDYHAGLKTFSEFTGSIFKFPFNPATVSNSFSKTSGDNTCIQNIDEVVDCSVINIDNGSAIVGGSGSSSTTLYDTNTYTGANGGSSGVSGSGSRVVWVCNAYHVTHSNPGECSVSGGSGTWIVIIYPDFSTNRSSNANKSSTVNCCDKTVVVGEIGINFFDLAIDIRTTLNLPVRSQKSVWLTSYATDTQLAELNNYIEANKDSNGNLTSEANEFAYLAIEAYDNGGDVDWKGLYIETDTPDSEYTYQGTKQNIPDNLSLPNGNIIEVTFITFTKDNLSSNKPVAIELIDCLKFALEQANNNLSNSEKITSINIYATTNGNHTGPNHSNGTAMDINSINGSRMVISGVTNQIKELQKAFDNFQYIRENFGPYFKHKYDLFSQKWNYNYPVTNYSDHIHISIRR